MKIRRLALLPALLAVLFLAAPFPARALPLLGSTMALNYRTDRILVKPKPGLDLGLLNLQLGATVLRTFPDLGNLQVLRVPAGSPILTLVALYRQSGLVQYAEPDYLVKLLRAPNDFRYWDGSLWGLHNTGNLGGTAGADIKAPEGWDVQNTADNIVVAVIDTGARLTHEDLAPNLWANPGESGPDGQGNDRRTNGLDDDGNGYVDDVHGINALTGSGLPMDDHGHGSHINGIIGGAGDNSVGVVGVAWRVQLMNCKFIDAQGSGAISDAVTGIDYARRKGARIINASWGSVDFQSAALRDAIAAARDTGILFVAAAGNSAGNNDATPLYPASYDLDNIIAVAATNRQDNLSFFSNYGATTVDLAAPGEDIFSCWGGSDSDYQYLSGSSMAAGYVSGVAAVLMAQAPDETFGATRQRILANTDPLPALQGKVATGGRLNLFRALGGATPTTPAAPSNLTATAVSTSGINLAWTDNAGNEDGFRVERSADGTTFAGIATVGANVTAYADTGLTADTDYHYRVQAFNGAGNSGYSNTASARTSAPAATTVTVTAADASAAEGGDTGTFTVTRAGGSAASLTVNYTMGGTAQNGTDYQSLSGTVTIPQDATSAMVRLSPLDDTAVEGDETAVLTLAGGSGYAVGSPGSASIVLADNDAPPPTVPAAPGGLSATATSSSAINLTWTDNADNEEGFRVERSTDNANFGEIATVGANATGYASTGLAADTTYYYRVRAFNGAGSSGYSNTASATTAAEPPPTGVTASFTANPTGGEAPLGVQFTDRSIGPVVAWSWTFGDGGSSTVRNPFHTYQSAGTFMVTLTVTGDAGQTDSESATITVTSAPPPPQPPAAPGNLSATAVSSSQINLTWTDNAGNEDGFRLERSTDNANFGEIATVGANATSYASTGLAADTTYYHRVRAFNGAGNSSYSNTASARTQTAPPVETATVTVVASDALANEAGPNAGEFVITRSGGTSAALTVRYTLGGTATNGGDYQTLSGVVTIPAGATAVAVRITPIDDRAIELPELVILTLIPGTGYQVGLPGTAVVTISDNDVLPLPLF